jgi:hypothetical protein
MRNQSVCLAPGTGWRRERPPQRIVDHLLDRPSLAMNCILDQPVDVRSRLSVVRNDTSSFESSRCLRGHVVGELWRAVRRLRSRSPMRREECVRRRTVPLLRKPP